MLSIYLPSSMLSHNFFSFFLSCFMRTLHVHTNELYWCVCVCVCVTKLKSYRYFSNVHDDELICRLAYKTEIVKQSI